MDAGNLIKQTDAAQAFGVTPRTLRDWGVPTAGKSGRETVYALQDLIDVAHRRGVQEGEKMAADQAVILADADGVEIDMATERARKLKAERIGQEIKNDLATRELIETRYAVAAVVTLQTAMNAVLESIPSRVKKIMPAITHAALEDIERECAKARNTIADYQLDWDEITSIAETDAKAA